MTLVYVLRIFEKRVGSVIRDCNSISSDIEIMFFIEISIEKVIEIIIKTIHKNP
jgi:hypothetical protein